MPIIKSVSIFHFFASTHPVAPAMGSLPVGNAVLQFLGQIVSNPVTLENSHTYNHVEVTREQPVLEDAPIGNIDTLTLVGDDDDSTAQGDVPAKVDVPSDRQVVELENLRNLLEALLELLNLLEVVSEFDDRSGLEHSLRVDHQLPMLQ